IPVVISVDLTVTADYNDKCCVLNGISGTATGAIKLSGGGDYFLGGGTGSGLPTSYGNSLHATSIYSPKGSLGSNTVPANGKATVTIAAVSIDFTSASLPSSLGGGAYVGIEISFDSSAWTLPTGTVIAIQTGVCGVAEIGCAQGTTLDPTNVTGSVSSEPMTCADQVEV